MVGHQDIRTALVAVLREVPGIGVVATHQPYARDAQRFRALYLDDAGRLNGWFIRRVGLTRRHESRGRTAAITRWRIQGYLALDDEGASELALDGIVDGIAAAVAADPSLGGAVATTHDPDSGRAGIALDDAGPVNFAGVLAHGARLSLTTLHHERL